MGELGEKKNIISSVIITVWRQELRVIELY